jgi:hypothetical protein
MGRAWSATHVCGMHGPVARCWARHRRVCTRGAGVSRRGSIRSVASSDSTPPSWRRPMAIRGEWRGNEICEKGRSWTCVDAIELGRPQGDDVAYSPVNNTNLRRKRKGRDSNPRDGSTPPNGFQDRRIQPLCHPSAAAAMVRTPRQVLHWPARSRRGGRVAEGTRLLSEYGDQYSIAGSNPALSVSDRPRTCGFAGARSSALARIEGDRAPRGSNLEEVSPGGSRAECGHLLRMPWSPARGLRSCTSAPHRC